MFYNATFRYRKSVQPERDSNGFLTDSQEDDFVSGTLCQVEQSDKAKHIIGTDGQEFACSYEVYLPTNYGTLLEVGDTMEVRLTNGTIIEKPILGTDVTDKKKLAVWL